MKRIKSFFKILGMLVLCVSFTGCGMNGNIDDYAVNAGYGDSDTVKSSSGVSKDSIKVGVIHLSDPAEGSGYTYTHDIGIMGMQQNLGLSDSQIIRKINVNDSDKEATRKAIKECIDEGCNIIFSTSWGYMETTAQMAEEYPDVYFSHGTGYMSNGKNFNNYFGRIYQPRYLSGIVAGMNTKTNKIGYVAAMGSENSEVTGGIDAFALGVYSVNPSAQIYVKVTNSWYDPEAEKAAASTLLDMNCDVITQHCDTTYPQLLAQQKNVYSIECNYDQISCEEIEEKLKEKKSKKEKNDEVSEIIKKLGLDKKYAGAVANAIIGYKFNVATIMNDKNLCDENGKEMSVSFASADYEEEEQKLSDELGEKFSVIENLKRLYSWYVIKQIMQGSDKKRVNYLSEAMVAKYEKHHAELKELKELFRDYKTQKEYSEFFHKELKAEQKDGKMSPAFLKSFGKIKKGEYVPNYANYIKGMKRCGDTQSKARENLYKCIKALLGDVAKDDERYIRICAEMENDSYLEKINDVSNSVIPYQLNEMEMEKILDIQGEFYPELKKNKELILKMLTSKIPYFVGPLNPGSRFAWMSKKAGMENKSVYPWNVEEVVDVDKTAEKFITRMTNYCTYLPDEKVLPKHSIIYQWYEVLTELSQISIDKIKLGKEIRDDIIQNLFLKKVSVSGENLKEHLKKSGTYNDIDNRVIRGYQGGDNFASSMSSYITFKKIFGEINMSNIDMIEQIIYWLTIFDDKKIIKRKIEQNYKDKINDSQLKRILKIKYTGWGQLSKKFLTGIKGDTGHTIIEMLEEGDPRWKELPNLIQIINRDEKIKTVIEENRLRYNGEDDLPDIIDKLHTSPANKRGIKQCMKVIEEIIEYMGRKPEQIFIEFAREEGEKVETKKVKDKLDKAIGKLKQEFKDYYNDDIKQELKDNEKRLDEEKVRLYFSQNGKSLYSAPSAGNQLSLDNLNQYDVDHIIPYSISQDDSMDNKVLVKKIENQNKGNRIVSDAFGNKADYKEMQNYWEMLYKAGLISEKKYNNLNKSLDEVFSKGFINRQLVETRQIVKNVATLINLKLMQIHIILMYQNFHVQ